MIVNLHAKELIQRIIYRLIKTAKLSLKKSLESIENVNWNKGNDFKMNYFYQPQICTE